MANIIINLLSRYWELGIYNYLIYEFLTFSYDLYYYCAMSIFAFHGAAVRTWVLHTIEGPVRKHSISVVRIIGHIQGIVAFNDLKIANISF